VLKIGGTMPKVSCYLSLEEKQSIERVADSQGQTASDFIKSCIIHTLLFNKEKISNDTQLKINQRDKTRLQRQLFYVKNALQRVYTQTIWQLQTYGKADHETIKKTLQLEIEGFAFLDKTTQKLLRTQFQHLEKLLEPKHFIEYCDLVIPQQYLINKKINKTTGMIE